MSKILENYNATNKEPYNYEYTVNNVLTFNLNNYSEESHAKILNVLIQDIICNKMNNYKNPEIKVCTLYCTEDILKLISKFENYKETQFLNARVFKYVNFTFNDLFMISEDDTKFQNLNSNIELIENDYPVIFVQFVISSNLITYKFMEQIRIK